MARMAVLSAALAAALFAAPAVAQKRGEPADGMPKGSYRDSCQCQLSGGLTLVCYCANINARLFQTTLDVRSCQAPKDIKNCDGRLKCVDGPAAGC